MDTIYLDQDMIKSELNVIETNLDTFNSDIGKLERLIDALNSAWKDEKAVNFSSYMRETFIKYLDSLESYTRDSMMALRDTVNKYNSFSEEFANKEINI